MPRKQRHQFKFDENSVNKLLQEIYDDSRNLKSKITTLYNKWNQFATDGGEVAAVGDQIVKLIMAEAKNQDQKIMLLKYLKEVVFMDKKDNDSNEKKEVSDDQRNQLLKMVDEEMKKKNRV
jgi:hypothetical protein